MSSRLLLTSTASTTSTHSSLCWRTDTLEEEAQTVGFSHRSVLERKPRVSVHVFLHLLLKKKKGKHNTENKVKKKMNSSRELWEGQKTSELYYTSMSENSLVRCSTISPAGSAGRDILHKRRVDAADEELHGAVGQLEKAVPPFTNSSHIKYINLHIVHKNVSIPHPQIRRQQIKKKKQHTKVDIGSCRTHWRILAAQLKIQPSDRQN